jgi:dipeptidyl aminopeptidase/acylaminoacyl peptidase
MRPALLALLGLALALPATAEPRVPTPDDLLGIDTVVETRIAPDGGRLAWTLRHADLEQDAYVDQIWLGTPEAPPLQLTRGEESARRLRWSPDGRWLGFLRRSGEPARAQVHLIDTRGGEPFVVSASETDVGGFEWSPDGSRIAFVAAEAEPERLKERKQEMGPFHVVRREYAHTHLRLLDLARALEAPAPGQPLTQGDDLSVSGFAWSPDGTRIAFGATVNPDFVQWASEDLYTVSVPDGEVRRLVDWPAPDGDPLWSPDGSQILFSTFAGRELFYPSNNELAVIDADGGEPRLLTREFDEEVRAIAWTDGGILFRALQRTSAHLFHLDPGSSTIRRVSDPDDMVIGSASVSADGRRVGFDAARPGGLAEAWLAELEPFSAQPLTRSSEQLDAFELGRREVINWTSRDGTAIEGVLVKPADFDASVKRPLLVVIHGGPTGVDQPTFRSNRYYPVDLWTARGALVLRVNYRGSAGYGEAFRTSNLRNLGVGDAWDVLSGVESLVEQGLVDPERIGCMGWSQGGYISAFLTTSSDHFAAVSVGAGISNWATYYYNTDITPFTIQYLGDDPVADPEVYAKTSPMTHVAGASTPTLIQHGENDRRVPIANAYELRQALEDRGVPVEMVVYEGFGHGISKPRSQRAVMWHNLAWFGHYLWGDPAPDLTRPHRRAQDGHVHRPPDPRSPAPSRALSSRR